MCSSLRQILIPLFEKLSKIGNPVQAKPYGVKIGRSSITVYVFTQISADNSGHAGCGGNIGGASARATESPPPIAPMTPKKQRCALTYAQLAAHDLELDGDNEGKPDTVKSLPSKCEII